MGSAAAHSSIMQGKPSPGDVNHMRNLSIDIVDVIYDAYRWEQCVMRLELWHQSVFLGSTVRCGVSVHAYDANGAPVGTFTDSDAAAAALLRRLPVAA